MGNLPNGRTCFAEGLLVIRGVAFVGVGAELICGLADSASTSPFLADAEGFGGLDIASGASLGFFEIGGGAGGASTFRFTVPVGVGVDEVRSSVVGLGATLCVKKQFGR